jgi:hypothetical protein
VANIQVIYPFGSTVTVVEQGSANDPAVQLAAMTAERDAAVGALAVITAERNALVAKIAQARIEVDQAIAEAQDARNKLD